MPKTTRKYKTKKKTTTKDGKREYQRLLMRDKRKKEKAALAYLRTHQPNVYRAIFGKKRKEK